MSHVRKIKSQNTALRVAVIVESIGMAVKLASLYNFTDVYTNFPSCRRDESKTSFPLQEGIFI